MQYVRDCHFGLTLLAAHRVITSPLQSSRPVGAGSERGSLVVAHTGQQSNG